MRPEAFKPGHLPQLDGLRAVAVMVVIASHSELHIFRGGFIGVDIFFVLSGFLITSLLVREFDRRDGRIALKSFYIRRALRLMPALVLLLCVFAVSIPFVFDRQRWNYEYVDIVIAATYISNWARAFVRHPPDYLGHTWSLSIEEQFYILWPLILLLLLRRFADRRHVILVTLAIALASAVLRALLMLYGNSVDRVYNGLDTRIDGLMLGAALGIATASGLLKHHHRRPAIQFLVPASLVGLFAFVSSVHVEETWLYLYGIALVNLLVLAVIYDLITRPTSIVGRVLSARWMVWTGSISYGLYLWHYPIFRVLLANGISPWTTLVAGSALTFVVAAASFHGFELRFLNLKNRLAPSGPTRAKGVVVARPAAACPDVQRPFR